MAFEGVLIGAVYYDLVSDIFLLKSGASFALLLKKFSKFIKSLFEELGVKSVAYPDRSFHFKSGSRCEQ